MQKNMKHDFSNIGELSSNIYYDGNIIPARAFTVLFGSVANEKEAHFNLEIQNALEYLRLQYNLENKPEQILQFEHVKTINKRVQKLVQGYSTKNKTLSIDYLIILKEGLMLVLTMNRYKIFYNSTISTEEITNLSTKLHTFAKGKKTRKSHFYMISSDFTGLGLTKFKTKKYEIDISLNYNDDFSDFDNNVRKFIKSKNKSGLVLMHGISGSGKTSYIRHLINAHNNKFIFLPLYMAETLTSPDFLPFLSSQKNSILIIEDAEKLIESRESDASSNGIATLLNMSDGLLSDALGIKIICTFNTGLEKIDKALLRKGRMINRYEFKELCVEKASLIAEKNNLNYIEKIPITLGDLYNIGENNETGQFRKKHVGF